MLEPILQRLEDAERRAAIAEAKLNLLRHNEGRNDCLQVEAKPATAKCSVPALGEHERRSVIPRPKDV